MRGPKTALIAAVVVTGVSATILRGQQMLAGSAKVPSASSGATASDPALAGRTARQLLRNGLDYLDNYDDPARALAFLAEAARRPAGLDEAEQSQLDDGLARAREAAKGRSDDGVVAASAPARPRGRGSRPGALVLASAPKPSGDETVRQIPADAPGGALEPPAMDLPPMPAAAPAEPAPAEMALAEPAPAPEAPLSTAPADLPVVEAPPELPATPAPEPAALPLPQPEAAPEPVPLPEAAPSPDSTPAPAPEPIFLTGAPTDAPPLPRPGPAAEPAPSPVPVPAPPPVDVPLPAPSSEPLPQPEAPPEMPGSALPPVESSVPDQTPVPVEPPPVEATTPTPLVAEPPAIEPAAPAPEPPANVTARVPSGPRPVAPAGPRRFAGDPRASMSASTPPPAPAAEELPPLPAPAANPVPEAGSIAAIPSLPGSGEATLRPEAVREVEEMARLQEESLRRNPPALPLGRQAGAGGSVAGTMGETGTTSRLELPRAPSPTEPRPIRVIPVPDEFVPLPARQWDPNRKYWAAAATCHMPLYFQDAVLERYGQGVEQALGDKGRYFSYPLDDPTQSNQRNQLLQPLYSSAMFISQIVALPYNMVMDPPWEAQYDLGYYRPGDRVPPDTYYLPTHGIGPPLRGRRY